MVNAQEWLDKNYPKNGTCQLETDKENYGKKRNKILKLNLSNIGLLEKLEGDLDLSDFINLQELDCHNNKITNLDISKNEELISLVCDNDQLSTPGLIEVLESLIKKEQEKIEQKEKELKKQNPESAELLQELFTSYREFSEFKKTGKYASDYDDKCEEYEEKNIEMKRNLKEKLVKEDMNRVRCILTFYEDLEDWKPKLEAKQSYHVNIKFPKQDLRVETYGGIYQVKNDSIRWIHRHHQESTKFTNQTLISPK